MKRCILLAVLLLLSVGACVDIDKLPLGLSNKDQSATTSRTQSAGGDVNNVDVNIVGDGNLIYIVAIFGLLVYGWVHASKGRAQATAEKAQTTKALYSCAEAIEQTCSDKTTDIPTKLAVMKTAADQGVEDYLHALIRQWFPKEVTDADNSTKS